MLRKVSSTTIWLVIFGVVVAVQAYSAFGQSSELTGNGKTARVGSISYQNRVTGSTKPGRGSLSLTGSCRTAITSFVGYMEVTMYKLYDHAL